MFGIDYESILKESETLKKQSEKQFLSYETWLSSKGDMLSPTTRLSQISC